MKNKKKELFAFTGINPFDIQERRLQFILAYHLSCPDWPWETVVTQSDQFLFSELAAEKMLKRIPN